MNNNDQTVCDPGATKYEGDETVYEGAATVADSAATQLDDGATMLEATLSDAAGRSDASASNLSIQKGDTILDTYEVESDAIEGGMGSVWRVHHIGWNTSLAMKRPQPKCFATEKSKADFIHECEAWIKLGLHPNIVSCYYVREISGTPSIFSEWMDGGSLESAINKGTLYEGTEAEQQERILDIAIQFARGLHYAHEAGLIHQDVKPDNLLLTKAGDAKVADFGLANARAALTVLEGDLAASETADAGKTIASPSGGYTPAYCSMEQMDGKELTRRTDIYSWAVSVMELYVGSRPWANGVVAGLSCRGYFEDTKLPMPKVLQELLAKCMEAEPDARPHDFAEVEAKLHEIYKAATGNDYPRPAPKAAADTADSLNNRALSMLDLGKRDEAEARWEKALERDAKHAESMYNQSLLRWRGGEIDDRKAVADVGECARGGEGAALLAELELECGNKEEALRLLGGHAPALWAVAEELAPLELKELRIDRDDGSISAMYLDADGDTLLIPRYAMIERISARRCERLTEIPTIQEPDFSFIAQDRANGRIALAYYTKKRPVEYGLLIIDGKTGAQLRNISKEEHIPFCFSPDGRELYTLRSSLSTHMDVLDAQTGLTLRTLEGRSMKKLALSADGKTLAVCSDNPYGPSVEDYSKTLVLYDAHTLECLHVLSGHEAEAYGAVFSPDGARLYSCSPDNTIRVWDVGTGECLAIWGAPSKRRVDMHIALSTDGALLAASVGNDAVRIIDANSGRCLRSVPFDGKGPMCFAGGFIAAYRMQGYGKQALITFRLPEFSYRAAWALSRVRDVKKSFAHEDEFLTAMAHAEAAYNCGSYAEAMESLAAARRVEGMQNDPRALALNREIGAHGTRKSLASVAPYHRFEWDANALGADRIYFSADGGLMLCKAAYCAPLYDTQTKRCLCAFLLDNATSTISAAALSPNGEYVYIAGKTAGGRLYNAHSGEKHLFCAGHEGRVWACGFSSDGTRLATGASDGQLLIYDTARGGPIAGFELENDVDALCFMPDGDTIIASGKYNTIQMLSISKRSVIREFSAGFSWSGYKALQISPDGRRGMVLADNAWRLFDIERGALLHGENAEPKLKAACFTGLGGQMMFGHGASTVVIADSPTHAPEFTVSDDYNGAFGMAVSENGRFAAVSSHNASVFVYELDWLYEV